MAGQVVSPIFRRIVAPSTRPERQRCLASLLESQFWPLDRLKTLEESRLRRLVQAARESSPWYHERLASLPDHELLCLADLQRAPFLEKRDLQAGLSNITGAGGLEPGTRENFSGGSTGEPVKLWQSRAYRLWAGAELDRNYTMCNGFRAGERRVFFWGSDIDSQAHRGLTGSARDVLQNQLWIDAFTLTRANVGGAISRARGFRPRLAIGYVSSLVEIAKLLESPISGLRGVQTAAETLTAEHRQLIEGAFGAPVYNRYGCREVGNLAHECDAHAGLHLLMENNVVEVVKPDGSAAGPGEEGEIVVTNLWNTATPLIRYRLGDIARVGDPEPCSCGRSSPRLEAVLGRTSDIIASPGGKKLHGEFFTHLFYGAPVRRFQVEQTSAAELHIRVVPDAGYSPSLAIEVTDKITTYGDPAFSISWETVDEIRPSASGKFRFTLSSLRGPGS